MTECDESNAPEESAEGAPPPAEPEDRIALWVARALVPPTWVSTLTRWIERQLVSDQYARLEQAGHNLEEAIPLAPVFVDLEAPPGPRETHGSAFHPELGFVWQALSTAPKLLRAGERMIAPDPSPELSPERRHEPAGYVLIGGPGQGKSTVGQFLCQVHRAALLTPRAMELGEGGRRALSTLRKQLEQDKLPAPEEPSLPLRIILRDFAAWMAKTSAEPRLAILRHLAHQIQPVAGLEVSPEELGQILLHAPWLLVLDGLDEVPPSAGRDPVLGAIRDFFQRFTSAGARGLVVATTRPQGYANEFSGLDLATRHLVPLSPERALDYARRLVAVRFAGQPDRQQKVIERLELASREDATARLMQSPLQVTILATLVDRIGRAPQERWRLFHDYYKVIYEREMERPGEAAELLRSHRGHIDRIHTKVGLLLQVEGERSGGTEALMTRARLEQVADETLAEDDDDKARRDRLVRKILDAAENRLVFLVPSQEGRIGFEIRSLQEFMAAWALTSKTDPLVAARLAQIAPAASFRNVLLFAASRCFADLSDLRDVFVDRLCPDLNEADEIARVILAGSILALEILEDGSALSQPKYARKLMALAARIVDLPPSELHPRLAAVGEGDMEAPLRAAVEAGLAKEAPAERLGAWATLIPLSDQGLAWARELGEKRWPAGTQEPRDIVVSVNSYERPIRAWLQGQMARNMSAYSPEFLSWQRFADAVPVGDEAGAVPAWFKAAYRVSHRYGPKIDVTCKESGTSIDFSLCPLRAQHLLAELGQILDMPSPSAAWRPWLAAARFCSEPSASSLARELDYLAADYDTKSASWTASLIPWPLSACFAGSAEAVSDLARRTEAGHLGDIADWEAAEARWRTEGVNLDALVDANEEEWPYSKSIATKGMVRAANVQVGISIEDTSLWLQRLFDFYKKTASPSARVVVALWLFRALENLADQDKRSIVHISTTVLDDLRQDIDGQYIFLLNILLPLRYDITEHGELINVLERVSKGAASVRKLLSNSSIGISPLTHLLSQLYCEAPERHGLLRLLALFAVLGPPPKLPPHLLVPDRFESPDVRARATLIALSMGLTRAGDIPGIVQRIIADHSFDYWSLHYAARVIQQSPVEEALRERLLVSLATSAPVEAWRARTDILAALTELFRLRRSGLDDPTTWDRLALPSPRPGVRPATAPPPSGGLAPIEAIELQNLRFFEKLDIAIPTPESGAGQWIILLGDNGLGKTTLLRGLALALSEPEHATALLASVPAPMIRHGAEEALCTVRTREGKYEARIAPHENDLEVARPQGSPPRPPMLFGYGCRRGSALGSATQDVAFSPPTLAVATLFDESARVIHAEAWLKDLYLDALQNKDKNPSRMQVYETVRATLQRILGVEHLEIRDRRVWVQGRDVGEVPLAALSDGYITTTGWIADLLARWIERAQRRGEVLEQGFNLRMEGVVLIDEIDLHLHPRWQCRVIQSVREAFPRMSFVVTTHNPLTLLGARPGEIFVLRRTQSDEEGRDAIAIEQIDLPPGARADHVLTGSWFGLSSVLLDRTALDLLAEQRRLLRRRDTTAEERQAMEAKVLERLGGSVDTSLERLVLSVAAEIMDERYRELSPEERARVLTPEERASLHEEVKQRTHERLGDAGASGGENA